MLFLRFIVCFRSGKHKNNSCYFSYCAINFQNCENPVMGNLVRLLFRLNKSRKKPIRRKISLFKRQKWLYFKLPSALFWKTSEHHKVRQCCFYDLQRNKTSNSIRFELIVSLFDLLTFINPSKSELNKPKPVTERLSCANAMMCFMSFCRWTGSSYQVVSNAAEAACSIFRTMREE